MVSRRVRAEDQAKRRRPPDFKSDDPHACGTHSHAIAIIPDISHAAQTLPFPTYLGRLQLECNLTGQLSSEPWRRCKRRQGSDHNQPTRRL